MSKRERKDHEHLEEPEGKVVWEGLRLESAAAGGRCGVGTAQRTRRWARHLHRRGRGRRRGGGAGAPARTRRPGAGALQVLDRRVQAREGDLAPPVLPELHRALQNLPRPLSLQVIEDGVPALPGAPPEGVLLGQLVSEEVRASVAPHPAVLLPVHAEVADRLVHAPEVHLGAAPHVVEVRAGSQRLAVGPYPDDLHGPPPALRAPKRLQVSNRGCAVLPLAPAHQIQLGGLVSQQVASGISPHPAVLV
eukprot:CAMPEP_0175574936 /NCGR_PEP_ID=MMETSP0096-20121207/44305_1 /TAXON_ID=311494 /ORGANISM="Alexandrium monilatum, Strain CCMP3105" /LENGTH=248 /DNA_ID=CAMNT_0016878447 /DNA_START=225 /DNA_END=969 /DNA_ORIENTATION=-